MTILNKEIILKTMIKHETLLFDDICKKENLGFVPNKEQLQFLIDGLTDSGHLIELNGVTPATYTITDKGIKEGEKLKGFIFKVD